MIVEKCIGIIQEFVNRAISPISKTDGDARENNQPIAQEDCNKCIRNMEIFASERNKSRKIDINITHHDILFKINQFAEKVRLPLAGDEMDELYSLVKKDVRFLFDSEINKLPEILHPPKTNSSKKCRPHFLYNITEGIKCELKNENRSCFV